MGDETAVDGVREADRNGRLAEWAATMSADARLFLRMMPFGGHVRVRPTAEVPENPANAPVAAATGNPFSWQKGWSQQEKDDTIEGFTIESEHLIKFLRASGAGRQESRDRVTSALTELMLRGLVRVYQDEVESPRYAATDEGLKVQGVLG